MKKLFKNTKGNALTWMTFGLFGILILIPVFIYFIKNKHWFCIILCIIYFCAVVIEWYTSIKNWRNLEEI